MDEQTPDVQQPDDSQPDAPPAPAPTPTPAPTTQNAGPMPVPQGATLRPIGAMPVPPGATLRPLGTVSSAVVATSEPATHIDPRTGDELPGAQPGTFDAGTLGRGFEKEAIKTAGGLAGLANKVLPNSMQIPMPTPAETDTKGVGETVCVVGSIG